MLVKLVKPRKMKSKQNTMKTTTHKHIGSVQRLALATVGLCLGLPGLTQAQYVFTPIDVPDAIYTAANGE